MTGGKKMCYNLGTLEELIGVDQNVGRPGGGVAGGDHSQRGKVVESLCLLNGLAAFAGRGALGGGGQRGGQMVHDGRHQSTPPTSHHANTAHQILPQHLFGGEGEMLTVLSLLIN